MVGKTTREHPKTEEEQLSEVAKAAFDWQGTCYDAFTINACLSFFRSSYVELIKIENFRLVFMAAFSLRIYLLWAIQFIYVIIVPHNFSLRSQEFFKPRIYYQNKLICFLPLFQHFFQRFTMNIFLHINPASNTTGLCNYICYYLLHTLL